MVTTVHDKRSNLGERPMDSGLIFEAGMFLKRVAIRYPTNYQEFNTRSKFSESSTSRGPPSPPVRVITKTDGLQLVDELEGHSHLKNALSLFIL